MSIQTTMRCNKCGTTISALSPHWTATFSERNDPEATFRHPTRVDICTECVHGVLGELISDARGERTPAEGGSYRVRIPASSRAAMRAEERMIQARLDAGELDEVLADQSLRRSLNEKLQAAADAANATLTEGNQP